VLIARKRIPRAPREAVASRCEVAPFAGAREEANWAWAGRPKILHRTHGSPVFNQNRFFSVPFQWDESSSVGGGDWTLSTPGTPVCSRVAMCLLGGMKASAITDQRTCNYTSFRKFRHSEAPDRKAKRRPRILLVSYSLSNASANKRAAFPPNTASMSFRGRSSCSTCLLSASIKGSSVPNSN